MSWASNYINNIAQSNEDYYKEYTQEWINWKFDDTTLLRKIKEEKYPFNEEYEEYEVQVDSVAEITVNIIKVIGDYITVLFKDCSHTNYRGQKYILDNETYLCYDRISDLSKIAETKLIRCNNSISWINNNQILTEKVFLGYELSSTNDSVSKKGIVDNRRLLIYMQYNENTKTIQLNQRFMFNHNQCFRVEEIDNYNNEKGLDEPTMIRLYLVYSASQPLDNKELNICDYYYENKYSINIIEDSIQNIRYFSGNAKCVVNHNGVSIDKEVVWKSENEDIVYVNSNGYYEIVGSPNQKTTIYCYLKDDDSIYDSYEITISSSYSTLPSIYVVPDGVTDLKENCTLDIECGVYIAGTKLTSNVECVPNWADNNYYTITESVDGYQITNKKMTLKPLILTFQYENCEDVSITINLCGLL